MRHFFGLLIGLVSTMGTAEWLVVMNTMATDLTYRIIDDPNQSVGSSMRLTDRD